MSLYCRIARVRGVPLANVVKRSFHPTSVLASDHGPEWDGWDKIGNREYVGYGINGQPMYVDRMDYPYPSIRFKEDDAVILKLREKEKGAWKALTLQEKKELYRASFCQTFSELVAPTGHWKIILAITCGLMSMAIWEFIAIHKFIYKPPPHTTTDEYKEGMLQYMIDIHSEPVTGYASKWDYEKNRWKS